MKSSETVWGSLEDIRNGALDNLNIGWYHIFASGQTVLCIQNGAPNLVRHPVNVRRIVTPGRSFETSITSFKNRNHLVRDLVRWQMIRGLVPRDHNEIQKAKDQGFVARNVLTKAPSFLALHARVLAQIDVVLQDKSAFRDDSKVNESRQILTNAIELIQTRFQWDPTELSGILQECLDEYFVRNVMDS